MNRIIRVFTAVLLICLLLGTAAWADNTRIISLGSVTAGSYLNELQVTTVEGLQSAALAEDSSLPSGLSWATRGDLLFLYGTPRMAGSYSFTFFATGAEDEVTELQCSMQIHAASPAVSSGSGASCPAGEPVTVSVSATVNDGGTLSYQWYQNSSAGTGGTAIAGATAASYSPDTSVAGTVYYYCVVTNTNNGVTASAESSPVSVTVIAVTGGKVNSSRELYTVGEEVAASDYSLTLTYSDGTSRTVNSGFTVSPAVIETAGEQNITLSYEGKDYFYAITADLPEEVIESISILRKPSKLVYTVGDTLDLTDLQLQVTTNLGVHTISVTDRTNTRGIRCDTTKLDTAGTRKVTVSLEDKEASFEVTVNEAQEVLQSIAIRSMPTKTEYAVGDSFDPAGLVLKVYYTKGTQTGTKDITEGFTCSPTTITKVGDQQITVTYRDMTCSFRVTVKAQPASTQAPQSTPIIVVSPIPATTATPTANGGNNDSGSNGAALIVLFLAVALLTGVVLYIWLTRFNGLEKLDRIIHKDRY